MTQMSMERYSVLVEVGALEALLEPKVTNTLWQRACARMLRDVAVGRCLVYPTLLISEGPVEGRDATALRADSLTVRVAS
jgi:hypothetical protein